MTALAFFSACKSRQNTSATSNAEMNDYCTDIIGAQEIALVDECRRLHTACVDAYRPNDFDVPVWAQRFNNTSGYAPKERQAPIVNAKEYCELWDTIKYIKKNPDDSASPLRKNNYILRFYYEPAPKNVDIDHPLTEEMTRMLETQNNLEWSKTLKAKENAPPPESPAPGSTTPPATPPKLQPPRYGIDDYMPSIMGEWHKRTEGIRPMDPEKVCRAAREQNLPAITYNLDSVHQPNVVRNLIILAKMGYWDHRDVRIGPLVGDKVPQFIFSGLPFRSKVKSPDNQTKNYSTAPYFMPVDLKHTSPDATLRGQVSPFKNPNVKDDPSIPLGSLVSFVWDPRDLSQRNMGGSNFLLHAYPFQIGIANFDGNRETSSIRLTDQDNVGFPITIGSIDLGYNEDKRSRQDPSWPSYDVNLYGWRTYRDLKTKTDFFKKLIYRDAKSRPMTLQEQKAFTQDISYHQISCTEILLGEDEAWIDSGSETPVN